MISIIIEKEIDESALKKSICDFFNIDVAEVSSLESGEDSKISYELRPLEGDFLNELSIYYDVTEFDTVIEKNFAKKYSNEFNSRILMSDDSILPNRFILIELNNESIVYVNSDYDETERFIIENYENPDRK